MEIFSFESSVQTPAASGKLKFMNSTTKKLTVIPNEIYTFYHVYYIENKIRL